MSRRPLPSVNVPTQATAGRSCCRAVPRAMNKKKIWWISLQIWWIGAMCQSLLGGEMVVEAPRVTNPDHCLSWCGAGRSACRTRTNAPSAATSNVRRYARGMHHTPVMHLYTDHRYRVIHESFGEISRPAVNPRPEPPALFTGDPSSFLVPQPQNLFTQVYCSWPPCLSFSFVSRLTTRFAFARGTDSRKHLWQHDGSIDSHRQSAVPASDHEQDQLSRQPGTPLDFPAPPTSHLHEALLIQPIAREIHTTTLDPTPNSPQNE